MEEKKDSVWPADQYMNSVAIYCTYAIILAVYIHISDAKSKESKQVIHVLRSMQRKLKEMLFPSGRRCSSAQRFCRDTDFMIICFYIMEFSLYTLQLNLYIVLKAAQTDESYESRQK